MWLTVLGCWAAKTPAPTWSQRFDKTPPYHDHNDNFSHMVLGWPVAFLPSMMKVVWTKAMMTSQILERRKSKMSSSSPNVEWDFPRLLRRNFLVALVNASTDSRLELLPLKMVEKKFCSHCSNPWYEFIVLLNLLQYRQY